MTKVDILCMSPMTKVDILYMHVTDDEGVRDELGYIIEIHNMGMCTYK
jgi:hypothetical protein